MKLGKWLPILSRVVTRTVSGNAYDDEGNLDAHWNVVQNNGKEAVPSPFPLLTLSVFAGIRAAQVVPHVHFHIIPRPPLNQLQQPPPSSSGPASASAALRTKFVMFGRGQRNDLADDEGAELAGAMRVEMAREARRIRDAQGIDLDSDLDPWDTGRPSSLGSLEKKKKREKGSL